MNILIEQLYKLHYIARMIFFQELECNFVKTGSVGANVLFSVLSVWSKYCK